MPNEHIVQKMQRNMKSLFTNLKLISKSPLFQGIIFQVEEKYFM